jgi:hypothetical protein
MTELITRRLARFTLLAVALALPACNSTDPEEEPEVATMRLTIGTQTIDVDDAGMVTGGPIAISANTSVSAQWLKADGSPEDLVSGAEFQLDVTSDNASFVTFTRTAAFAGTLVRVGPGSTVLRFSLFHTVEMHEDFGPFPVNITVS